MQNKNAKKRTFSNVLGEYFISHEKSGHVLQRGRMVAVPTHMRSVQIRVKQTQNLPETRRDES